MQKHYYVCIEYSKDCIKQYQYQYCKNKTNAQHLLSILKKYKNLIGWIDFVWDCDFKTIPATRLHGNLFTEVNILEQLMLSEL